MLKYVYHILYRACSIIDKSMDKGSALFGMMCLVILKYPIFGVVGVGASGVQISFLK